MNATRILVRGFASSAKRTFQDKEVDIPKGEPIFKEEILILKQGCGSGSGADPDPVRIRNVFLGSGSGIIIPDPTNIKTNF